MTKRVVFETPEDGVRILIPIPESECGLTLQQIIQRDIPAGVPYTIVEENDIPKDRLFRDCWKNDLSIDMEKAKTVWQDHWRDVRKSTFKVADIEFLKALQAWVKKNIPRAEAPELHETIDRSEALRDVTLTDLSGVKTTEDLRAVWPEILNP